MSALLLCEQQLPAQCLLTSGSWSPTATAAAAPAFHAAGTQSSSMNLPEPCAGDITRSEPLYDPTHATYPPICSSAWVRCRHCARVHSAWTMADSSGCKGRGSEPGTRKS